VDDKTVNATTAHSLETVVVLLSKSFSSVVVAFLESHVARPFGIGIDCGHKIPSYFSLKNEVISGVVFQCQTESSLRET